MKTVDYGESEGKRCLHVNSAYFQNRYQRIHWTTLSLSSGCLTQVIVSQKSKEFTCLNLIKNWMDFVKLMGPLASNCSPWSYFDLDKRSLVALSSHNDASFSLTQRPQRGASRARCFNWLAPLECTSNSPVYRAKLIFIVWFTAAHCVWPSVVALTQFTKSVTPLSTNMLSSSCAD